MLHLKHNSDVATEGVYLWEVERLSKYFPSEGDGIENIMYALSKAGQNDPHGSQRARYNKLIGDHECILANIRRSPGKSEETVAYIRAGPREKLHFNPKNVNAAIVTCGGLCPGLNNVVREITRSLFHMYGIDGKVWGIVGGYKGFYDPKVSPVIILYYIINSLISCNHCNILDTYILDIILTCGNCIFIQ